MTTQREQRIRPVFIHKAIGRGRVAESRQILYSKHGIHNDGTQRPTVGDVSARDEGV